VSDREDDFSESCVQKEAYSVDSTQAGSLCYTNSPECGVMSEKRRRKLYEPKATTRQANDRGRESDCSPSLRTGLAVFQRPALQLMGSTVRLRGFEVS
jgi:hypothetical protein